MSGDHDAEMIDEFQGFPKMARFNREVVCTEKIDGSNACIYIPDIPGELGDNVPFLVGSRTRWITPGNDNFGFAAWCYANQEELLTLGPGRHFMEWWGSGIQRNYGLKERRASLFNVLRWGENRDLTKYPLPPPACLSVVPEIWRGPMEELNVPFLMDVLAKHGSYATDFPDPEGIVIFHIAAGVGFKKTLKDDGIPKSLVAAQ